jgi:hypothetical protein
MDLHILYSLYCTSEVIKADTGCRLRRGQGSSLKHSGPIDPVAYGRDTTTALLIGLRHSGRKARETA